METLSGTYNKHFECYNIVNNFLGESQKTLMEIYLQMRYKNFISNLQFPLSFNQCCIDNIVIDIKMIKHFLQNFKFQRKWMKFSNF